MTAHYRPFTSSDAPIIATMISQLYQEDPGGHTPGLAQIQQTFEELTRHPDKGAILAFEIENKIIGYVILINYWSNEYGGNILHIDELYILPKFRGERYS